MAIQKFDGLLIGKGALTTNTASARILTSTYTMGVYDPTINYNIADAVVEYLGSYFRTKASGANIGNLPGPSSAYWEPLAIGVKDGDIVCVVSGVKSDIMIRNNSRWVSLIGIPQETILSDNSTGQLFIQIPLAVARGATIEFSAQRGAYERRGTIRYQSDGNIGLSGVSLSDTNNVDVGAGDVGITFDAQVDGTGIYVQVLADVDSQGVPAYLKYVLRGWS